MVWWLSCGFGARLSINHYDLVRPPITYRQNKFYCISQKFGQMEDLFFSPQFMESQTHHQYCMEKIIIFYQMHTYVMIHPKSFKHGDRLLFFCKDTELFCHSFMCSLVSNLSGSYPLPAMHSLLVTLDVTDIWIN